MEQFINMFADYSVYFGIPLLFLLIVAWVFRPGAKKRYKADGKIPFASDEE